MKIFRLLEALAAAMVAEGAGGKTGEGLICYFLFVVPQPTVDAIFIGSVDRVLWSNVM